MKNKKISVIASWLFIFCFLFVFLSFGNSSKASITHNESKENNNIVIKEQDEEITVADVITNDGILLFAKNPL